MWTRISPSPIGVNDGGQLAGFRLPGGGDLLERWRSLASGDKVPAPVVEASHVPTVFEPVVEQENLAQEVADAPVIVFNLKYALSYVHYKVNPINHDLPGTDFHDQDRLSGSAILSAG